MPHDPSQVLLGTTQSSDRPGTTDYASDPTTFQAGVACRVGTDGLLTLTKGINGWAGISLGASLSDINTSTVLRAGSRVPILLSGADPDYVTPGASVFIDDANGLAAAEGVGATASNAIYVSEVMTGVKENGATTPVALVDMIGGL